jgi:DNA-binding IscR family transcriptional regulator
MKISDNKKNKICEQILSYLYSVNPRPVFTVQIAQEVVRDEEFTKKLLFDLKKKGLINEINKNPKGIIYIRRIRWQLTDNAYEAYKKATK